MAGCPISDDAQARCGGCDSAGMRIISYNIMGGEGRADPLAEVILAQRADIVALVEAEKPVVLERLAHRLEMDYAEAHGPRHASAVFSRWPIRHSINHALIHPDVFSRSLVETSIVDPATGDEWIVAVLHLHPFHYEADE